MEIHQLRYLVAVVEEGSFTAAAQRVVVSQSGVSAQVAKLEHELGLRLIERGPRGLSLTAAGEAVLPLAREALGAVERISEVGEELNDVVRGRVRLGMVRGCSIPPFLDALADFGREHPGVELVLAEEDSDVLQGRVLHGSLDLALVGWAGTHLAGLHLTTVVDEPVTAVVPADHPLAQHASVRWSDLDPFRLLALTRGTGVRAAADASGVPRVDLEASSPETLLGLARRGAGVALLSASMVPPDLVALPVRDAPTNARLGLAVRDGRPAPATAALHARLVAALGGSTDT